VSAQGQTVTQGEIDRTDYVLDEGTGVARNAWSLVVGTILADISHFDTRRPESPESVVPAWCTCAMFGWSTSEHHGLFRKTGAGLLAISFLTNQTT
jgi:hypothetical protein